MDSLDGIIGRLAAVGAVGKAEQASAVRDQANALLSTVAAIREQVDETSRRMQTLMGGSGSGGVAAPVVPPDRSAVIYRDRHGFLTDGVYRVSTGKNRPHMFETRASGKSYFNEGTDVERLSLEAARAADRNDRWRADPGSTYRRRAKVSYDHDVGIHARTGQPTRVVNVYRKRSGTIHISPGSPK